MKPETITQAHDPILPLAMTAMRRAAQRAREIALRTNTALIVVKEGKVIRIEPYQIREESANSGHNTNSEPPIDKPK